MTATPRPTPAQNPFSTCRVRPGAMPYLFPPGDDAARLVERLRQNGWRGQIVGPHGSGKSSLLATLIPAVRRAGRPTLLIELHDGARRLPIDLRQSPNLTAGAVVIVDGYEQLSLWNRWRLKRFCRSRGLGLLVTSHAPVGLPPLFCTPTSAELAGKLVEQLLGANQWFLDARELERLFELHRGDVRELLFDLYDRYEHGRIVS